MPELPEVETIRSDLEKYIVGKKITGVDFLWPGIVKDISPAEFERSTLGQKIEAVNRRAKNIDIKLEDNLSLLLHMKMTGHLIITDNCWKVDDSGKWIKHQGQESPLYDPLNQYIRVIFYLDDGKLIAFSDLRKFAYIKLVTEKELQNFYDKYGPEPLDRAFTREKLAGILKNKKTAIKKVLMDPKNIAGIGNIYADEILYESKIHPLQPAETIDEQKINHLYTAIRSILKKAVKLRGTSTSDFRDTDGKKGTFGEVLAVYRRTGLPCQKDGAPIKRIVVGGRGTHFCPKEQVLEK